MLCGRQKATGARTADKGAHVASGLVRVGTECPGGDDGVAGIAVHVGNGRESDVESAGKRLTRLGAGGRLKQLFASSRGIRSGVREDGRTGDLLADAPLDVGRDQQRDGAPSLEPRETLRRGRIASIEDDEAADGTFIKQRLESLEVLGRFHRWGHVRTQPWEHQLSCPLA